MTKPIKPFETWIIKHKTTGEVFVAPSGKQSWKAKGHAKNAWLGNDCYSQKILFNRCDKLEVSPVKCKYGDGFELPKFDQQDTWELVKIVDPIVSKTEKAEQLLKMCLGRVDDDIEILIKEYFDE